MANRRDDYMNKRSWLIDTAETPADKKKLKSDLAKLDKKFNPNRVASTSKSKSADGSDTKPYNVRPIKPSEIIQDKTTAKAKTKTTVTKKAAAKPIVKAAAKAPAKPTVKPKAPVKKKVLVMPDKISPSKMTPAQKARYLKNPERYNG